MLSVEHASGGILSDLVVQLLQVVGGDEVLGGEAIWKHIGMIGIMGGVDVVDPLRRSRADALSVQPQEVVVLGTTNGLVGVNAEYRRRWLFPSEKQLVSSEIAGMLRVLDYSSPT